MTVPVSTWVSVSSDGTEEFREMCFFIGEEFQENPPKPTNELVFIKERPTMTIFTRTIGGYVKDRKWAEEADHVKKGKEIEIKLIARLRKHAGNPGLIYQSILREGRELYAA